MSLIEQVKQSIRRRPASSTDALNAACGRFNYRSNADGTITITPGRWAAENIIGLTTQAAVAPGSRCDLPDWPPTPTFRNGQPSLIVVRHVWVHRLMEPSLRAAWGEIRRRGLAGQIRTYDGCWVPRHILYDPTRPLSIHSWAMAIDFAARWNGYGAKPQLPDEVFRVFEYYGFACGARWRGPGGANDYSMTDGMHVEFTDGNVYNNVPWRDQILAAN